MCQGIIYKSTNLINGKCYIGKTITSLTKRKNNHIYTSKKFNENGKCSKDEYRCYFYNALNKYGIENFKWEIIYECDDELILNIMETMKIIVNHSHRSEGGYNITWGGEGCSGYRHTEETKKKMSKSLQGKNNGNGNVGYKHTEEARKKMSKSQKGHSVSEETRQKISKAQKNKIIGEEVRKKISEANKGHIISEEQRQNLSKALKGRQLSEEHKQKLSEAAKGRIFSEETKKKMSVSQKVKNIQKKQKRK